MRDGPLLQCPHHLPEHNYYFVGREEELQSIETKFRESVEEKENFSLQIIAGMGGIGKSQLANRFAENHIKNGEASERKLSYDYSLWIKSYDDDEIGDQMEKYINELVPKGILDKDWMSLYRVLSKGERVLLIFDNATPSDFFKLYFDDLVEFCTKLGRTSTCACAFHVLITSRREKWDFGECTKANGIITRLGPLSLCDAEKFLREKLEGEPNQRLKDTYNDLPNLAKELDCLPLALTQIAAYLLDSFDETPKHCVDILLGNGEGTREEKEDKTRVLLRDRKDELPASYDHFFTDEKQRAVYDTWYLFRDREKDDLINICSFLSSDGEKGISRSLFPSNGYVKLLGQYDNMVGEYIKFFSYFHSLIDYNHEKKTLHIHGLVQKVVQLHLKETKKHEASTCANHQQNAYEECLNQVTNKFCQKEVRENEKDEFLLLLYPHCIMLLHYQCMLKNYNKVEELHMPVLRFMKNRGFTPSIDFKATSDLDGCLKNTYVEFGWRLSSTDCQLSIHFLQNILGLLDEKHSYKLPDKAPINLVHLHADGDIDSEMSVICLVHFLLASCCFKANKLRKGASHLKQLSEHASRSSHSVVVSRMIESLNSLKNERTLYHRYPYCQFFSSQESYEKDPSRDDSMWYSFLQQFTG